MMGRWFSLRAGVLQSIQRATVGGVVAAFVAAGVVPVRAAVIGAPGVDANDPSWRTTTVAKPLDADHDNVYGTAGYLLFRFNSPASSSGLTFTNNSNGTLNRLPSYLAVSSVATTGASNQFGAKLAIDNPGGSGTAASGVAYRNAGFADTNVESYLNLTFSSIPAGGVRVGILTDVSPGNDAPTSVVLTQTSGSGTGSQSYADVIASTATAQADWYFFDLTGVAAGDVFTVGFGNRASGSKPTVSGLTVDALPAPTPEPGALGLVAVGGIALVRRRRV